MPGDLQNQAGRRQEGGGRMVWEQLPENERATLYQIERFLKKTHMI
jgi:hypothetical protein